MGLFDKLFRKSQGQEPPKGGQDSNSEHCVIIEFNYGLDSLDALYQLEEELDSILIASQVGDCDGHEIAIDLSDGILYLYGSNAEAIFKTVKQTLEHCSFMKGATAKLRFGPPEDGIREIEVNM